MAAEAAAQMDLPPGFRSHVYASEPLVRQPIAITTDAQSRLWVAENYTFAEMPLRWDTALRDLTEKEVRDLFAYLMSKS